MQSIMQMCNSQNATASNTGGTAAKSKDTVKNGFFCLLNTLSESYAKNTTQTGDPAEDTSPQTVEAMMALMMVMCTVQDQTQFVTEGGTETEGTSAPGFPAFFEGGRTAMEAFDLLKTYQDMQPALLSELKNALQAYVAEQQEGPAQPKAAGSVEEVFSIISPAVSSEQADTALEAVLKKLGLESGQILQIKQYLTKEQGTVAPQSEQYAEGEPVPTGITSQEGEEMPSGQTQTQTQAQAHNHAEPESAQTVSWQPAGQTAQVAGLQEAAGGTVAETAEGTHTDIFSQLVERAAAGIQEGKYQMSIQLHPEHLGKVSIRLAMDADGLVVRIHPQNNGVESTISNQLVQLEQALKDKGIPIVRMEVGQENLQSGAGQSGNPHDDQSRQRKGYYAQGDDEGIEAAGREIYMALQPYLFGNSFEFQA